MKEKEILHFVHNPQRTNVDIKFIFSSMAFNIIS